MATSPKVTDPLTRKSTNPEGPKLRDSCHRCAASKLKCSKEKPTCARCAKRGVVCEYFATKRAGRKRGRLASNAPTMTQPLPPHRWPSVTAADPVTSPGRGALSVHSTAPSYSEIPPALHPSKDPTTASTPNTINAAFDDFLASQILFSSVGSPNHEGLTDVSQIHVDDVNPFLNPSNTTSLLPLGNVLADPNEATSELGAVSNPLSLPHGLHPDSTSPCLTRALCLLKQLFPTAAASCQSSQGSTANSGPSELPTIKAVIADNERTIQAFSRILQCPCSQDSYLLLIMSFVVFKVMGWYAAAACQTASIDSRSQGRTGSRQRPHGEQVQQCPAVVDDYCVEGEDQGRMAAQLVLSELHRVQQLVNILAQRLKSRGARSAGSDPPSSGSADGSDSFPGRAGTLPFPSSILNQLEVDLRKRLRQLSAEIVEMLQRG